MATLIITEKTSQAKDVRAAIGNRHGQILPAEGHLVRLAEPEEVNPAWQKWSCALLKPGGLYPTRPDPQGNKPAKLKAIAQALKTCDEVIIATDCDREGQLIGQEILEHLGYRGRVRRALFTAQDPKTVRQAFDNLKSNTEFQALYEAAVARQQADQIFNLSLTRTATKMLLAPGMHGVLGIGRVKTPTLAIVCLRELEIRNFRPEDYFEVVATATVASGRFILRHAPPAKDRIKDRARAEAIARAADGHRGALSVATEERRQGPPKLYDLPSLQKTCGQRWGWTADRTLAVAQELYDGDGKKLITYPRAEARYLSENQMADVPGIIGALTRLRGFAHLEIGTPVIRRGKSGHFCDRALEGVSHHAIVPNINVMEDLETRLERLTDDEKRLFALVCRSYLAAVMPDYEYRQTTVTLPVPMAGGPVVFRAIGRVPLRLGWKAVYGGAEPERDANNKPDTEPEQVLPPLRDGETAVLSEPQVEAKRTQPPPRYNEGTLIDAMQNAWRFVEDPTLRDRLKEAKGIGTPATRAEVIKGLKRQNLVAAEGKVVVPTAAGLALFERLRQAAPALVDPGTTAVWEMRLDDVVVGRADFRAVIEAIADEAARLIGVLQQQAGNAIPVVVAPVPATGTARNGRRRTAAGKDTGAGAGAAPPATRRTRKKAEPAADGAEAAAVAKSARTRTTRARNRPAQIGPAATTISPVSPVVVPRQVGAPSPPASAFPTVAGAAGRPMRRTPTERMVAFARSLASRQGVALPPDLEQDFDVCRRFLDEHIVGNPRG